MMEQCYEYDYVGNQNFEGRNKHRGCINPVYMVPNPDLLDKDNEYEALQTNALPSKKQSPSEQHANQSDSPGGTNNQGKCIGKNRGCIGICILLTIIVTVVITLAALAIGALSLRGSSNAQLSSAQASQHYTHLMEEISALKSLLSQMSLETKRNISQLDNRLSSSVYSLSSSASRLSTSAYVASSINRLSTSVYIASSRAYWNSYSVSRISYSTIATLSSSVFRLSTSLAFCTSC